MISDLLAEIPKRTIDQSAMTVREIIAETCQPENWVRKMVQSKVDSGQWERVWKKTNGGTFPAYRRAT